MDLLPWIFFFLEKLVTETLQVTSWLLCDLCSLCVSIRYIHPPLNDGQVINAQFQLEASHPLQIIYCLYDIEPIIFIILINMHYQ